MARNDDYSSEYRRQRRSRPSTGAPRHERRRSSTGYRTDAGISNAKLNSLNEQMGWSAPSPPRAKHRSRSDSYEHVFDEKTTAPPRSRGAPLRYLPKRREYGSNDHHRREYRHSRTESSQPLFPSQSRQQTHRKPSRPSQSVHHRPTQDRPKRQRRHLCLWIGGVALLLILALIIGLAVGLTVGKRKKSNDSSQGSDSPSNSNLGGISPSSIPASAQGTYLDPFTWYDTTDFNLTYTGEMVGGLSVMGLNSSWNDHVLANPSSLYLDQPWNYGTKPVRGVNIGGWLSTEPFIMPSLFNTTYKSIVDHSIAGPPYLDEWSLTSALGLNQSNQILDKHYSQFAPSSTFSAIRAAGFDHVRIPFPYWAVTTYPGDPYVPHTAWRYLLRGIEYARQNGLRVNLDLHSAPGSQNGWNHSGKQGAIGWLNGTDGQLNADRTLQIHQQLSTFFGQPRYKNIITMYGIINEPRMDLLNRTAVLNWTSTAVTQLRHSSLPNSTVLVVSNGFLPIPFWHNALPGYPDPASSRILLDAHQYVIFNADQIALNHSAKLDFACNGWSQQSAASMNESTGFGTFLCGEWSQADTDCGYWLNGVGTGTRWEGTLNIGQGGEAVTDLQPSCAAAAANGFQQTAGQSKPCSCSSANAPGSSYNSTYKKWLRMFADAQIRSFEQGWGWFYWTWEVEDGPGASQLSWRRGVEAGTLPSDISEGAAQLWNCGANSEPDWTSAGLPESY